MSDKGLNHLTALVGDLAFMDKATARLKLPRWNETESVNLAISMALENSELFTAFCESQYPKQGKVLYRALGRAQKKIGIRYRSPKRTRKEQP